MLFNTASLTDVGCTMRLAPGPALRKLQPLFTVEDGAFGPEMMMLSIVADWRIVQLPVNYKPRSGHPGTTENPVEAIKIGLQMISLILRTWKRRAELRGALAGGEGRSEPSY
jgi:hypothetical protein